MAKYLQLVSNEERAGRRCFFCNTKRSVKYDVKIEAYICNGNDGDGMKDVIVPCCNMCALKHNDILR